MENGTFSNTLDDLYSYTNYETRRNARYSPENYTLSTITALLAALGDPQKKFKSIHIAGTKGKGSTAWFLANFFHHNFKTGLYTSPHILSECERIKVGLTSISQEEFTELFRVVNAVIVKNSLSPTVFDIFTAMSFLHFANSEVEWAIIETGMGGRLDSTNVIVPEISVITRIHLDHTDKLGKTISKIASEKAGIIKSRVPVFVSPQSRAAMDVLKIKAAQENSFFQVVRVKSTTCWIPPFQRENFSLAKDVFQFLVDKEKFISSEAALSIVGAVPSFPIGRYQKIQNCVVDGAHNPYAIKCLVRSLLTDPEFKTAHFSLCFYALPDKKIDKMLAEIPLDWEILFFALRPIHIEKHTDWKMYVGKNNRKIQIVEPSEWTLPQNDRTYIFTGSFLLVKYFFEANVVKHDTINQL